MPFCGSLIALVYNSQTFYRNGYIKIWLELEKNKTNCFWKINICFDCNAVEKP